jgi:hypothetical protein
MPIYIQDEETTTLLETYAKLTGKTKTGALRDLLREQVRQLDRSSTAQERYKRIMDFVASLPDRKGPPITKETYDALYDYIDEERGDH